MNINQGEIWMTNFEPSVGSEIQKLRPAIVVNDDRVGRFGIKIVIPITEWKDNYINYPWILKIEPDAKNGLSKTSSIECFQIKSFAVDRFHKKIGQVDSSLLLKIHQTIAKTLNLSYKIS
ncbi:MAG: type II toxin-antitoxin system PemK/MazF family toxin [Erysipelotrichia bacterium]|jgi:mRNA interferase MazF|nr:type II toxin-antitoxin system PemK/MazF family toxin [Erysipelotrichia bacterium]